MIAISKPACFTLVELLVVVAVMAALLATLLPALAKAKDAGRGIACSSNLRQIGQAAMNYAGDNSGDMPPVYAAAPTASYRPYWHELLVSNACCGEKNLQCPAMPADSFSWLWAPHYGINSELYYPRNGVRSQKLETCVSPSLKEMALDSWKNMSDGTTDFSQGIWRISFNPSAAANDQFGRPAGRHAKKCGILWMDGHTAGVVVSNVQNPFAQAPFRLYYDQSNIYWTY